MVIVVRWILSDLWLFLVACVYLLWWRHNWYSKQKFEELHVRFHTRNQLNEIHLLHGLKFSSTSMNFVSLCWYASECNEQYFARNHKNIIQTQWFFKLHECSIKKRPFMFYRRKPCYKVVKYNRPLIRLTDFFRLCWYASECNEQHFARNQKDTIQTQWFFKLHECSIKKR